MPKDLRYQENTGELWEDPGDARAFVGDLNHYGEVFALRAEWRIRKGNGRPYLYLTVERKQGDGLT